MIHISGISSKRPIYRNLHRRGFNSCFGVGPSTPVIGTSKRSAPPTMGNQYLLFKSQRNWTPTADHSMVLEVCPLNEWLGW